MQKFMYDKDISTKIGHTISRFLAAFVGVLEFCGLPFFSRVKLLDFSEEIDLSSEDLLESLSCLEYKDTS